MEQTEHPVLKAIQEVKKAVIGKDDCIVKVMTAILAGGHILIEDIPGVGKTTMALAFSRALNLEQNRIQFTPDVLPADVTGFSLYQKDINQFVYQPGAVMCNILLADEINRTSPKTQAALLEVMEEGRVTVDQVTRELPKPFVVIATQNPVGSAGTSMLPESQLDRFMICMSMGYPDIEYELEIVKGKISTDPLEMVTPVMDAAQLMAMQKQVSEVFIHDAVYRYIGKLVSATREHSLIELGISPRGTIALAKMVQALAYLRGRKYVLPEDVEDVFLDVAAHRIRMNAKARVNHVTAENVLKDILEGVQKPSVVKK
ncbi:MAG: MoxR family ATPase [Clostridia bacterium]|nr:MoxR family ATPase [Clostridia bacterium]NCC42212.1 MoxR family ATPase [Clostridia bacterium]